MHSFPPRNFSVAPLPRPPLAAALAGLALAWMAWRISRGERERDPLLRAWRRLERRYRRLGRGRAPHEPPRQWAARVAADLPRAGQHLTTLAERFAAARYAPKADRATVQALVRDLRAHRP